ncbi:MAG: CyaY protein [Bacteroidia bacterium]|jgi:CyaY protein
MEESLFIELADKALEATAQWLEDFDPDEVDFSTTDGVVTLEFEDGTRYVLNRQRAAGQMWFAAGAKAWHYNWDDSKSQWVDMRDGHEMFGNMRACVAAKLAA